MTNCVISAGVDILAERVVLDVYVATEERQRAVDAEYGARVERQQGAFEPID